MRGPLVRKYYEGWVSFLKLCRDFEGLLTVLPGANDVAVRRQSVLRGGGGRRRRGCQQRWPAKSF